MAILPTIIANNAHQNFPKIADDNDKVPTLSIIDILSSNESYSTLLNVLQRNDLIDYVNELENVTFLAPINEAFDNYPDLPSKITQDQLDRFIIDEPVFREDIDGIKLLSTLNRFGSPYIKNFEIPLLLDHRTLKNGDEVYCVENANVISDDVYLPTIDTVVLTVDAILLDLKEYVCQYFQNSLNRNTGDERFKIFSSLLMSQNTCKSTRISNATFLIPSDDSLDLNFIERKYLLNVRGLEDKNLFLSNFLVDGIIGGNLHNNSITSHNWNKEKIRISSSYEGDEIIINNSCHAASSNFLLSDGIIHYFDEPIYDYRGENFPQFTPRKYLLGLEYEQFVDEVDFRRLSHLIDDSSIHQTIFVSKDYKLFGTLQNQLLYHFIEGDDVLDVENGGKKLLNSKFCLSSKFCQKVKFEKSLDGETVLLNSDTKVVNKVPYKVGNASIYILNDDISLPSKLQTEIASQLTGFGRSIEFFKRFNLLKSLSKNDEVYTIFFPSSELWSLLDLTLDYLISNEKILEKFVHNLVIKGLIYHDYEGSNEFETLLGETVTIEKVNNSLIIDDSTVEDVSFAEEILYSNGVVHPITENLPIPRGLEITNHDLFKNLDSLEFEKIINVLNLTSIFNSSLGYSILLPSSNSLIQENITSLLTDIKYLEKFAKLHILPPGSLDMILDCYSSSASLNDNSAIDYNSTTLIPTLMNDTYLTCRQLASGNLMLSITEGSGNEVRILRHGLALTNLDFNSGILLLDRPLNPNWLNSRSSKLYLHLPLIAILLGILIGIICVILGFGCCLILTLGNSNLKGSNDPIENDEERIEHVISVSERMPLLNDDEENQLANSNGPLTVSGGTERSKIGCCNHHLNHNSNKNYNSFDTKYSINASASPIDVNYE